MSLFKKIFYENLKKAKTEKELKKFEEDVGPLKGIFSWKRYDAATGVFLEEKVGNNQITELSKSSVIRLISQGISTHVGQISPEDYRISRMRFGNAPFTDHNSVDDLRQAYYDPNEVVNRDNATTSPGGAPFYAGAGGGITAIAAEAVSNINKTIPVTTFGAAWAINNTISINITDAADAQFQYVIGERPPSHKTFVLKLRTAGNVVVQQIDYTGIYTRDPLGNTGTETIAGLAAIVADTKLVWEAATKKWKLLIKLSANAVAVADINNIVIEFKVGTYNIMNSIVPRSGSNAGSGNTTSRFTSLDYYDILTSSIQYVDSPAGFFVDDYSVTFSAIQSGSEGNGIQGPTYPVVYTEAFLMDSVDNVFSVIRLEPPPPYGAGGVSWVKDISSAYLLSWTIQAVL